MSVAKRLIIGGHDPVMHEAYDCDYMACMFCDGGLFACTVCGAFEGATPDDCPGRLMTADESDAVYAGQLNYRAGEWRKECCQIMRHTYDLVAYMTENGYAREDDPALPDGFRWVRVTA